MFHFKQDDDHVYNAVEPLHILAERLQSTCMQIVQEAG